MRLNVFIGNCKTIILGVWLILLLFPHPIFSGTLNPSGPPGPTMKTLDEIPPTWSQSLDATNGETNGCNSSRFDCVLGNEAVLDKETGLVWERSPSRGAMTWGAAMAYCYNLNVGNRMGWRLAELAELTSLVDPNNSDPALPDAHPFQRVENSTYWSYTTRVDNAGNAWVLSFSAGLTSGVDKTTTSLAWCVRGRQ